jgi:hypothetical protein
MNRVIIIPSDGLVIANGLTVGGMDLSFMDPTIHAVQWYGTFGEIERKNSFGRITANEPIESLAEFQPALDLWQSTKDTIDAEQAAQLATEQTTQEP